MNQRRTTDRLVADVDERLRLTERLPQRLAGIQGWAHDGDDNVAVTVDVHGALRDLRLAESALALGPEGLGRQIVELAHQAQQTALAEGVNVLGDVLGTRPRSTCSAPRGSRTGSTPTPRSSLTRPGSTPNAHRWRVIG